jgi:23S rRNA pseudouridine1911/1915/1917 synthase
MLSLLREFLGPRGGSVFPVHRLDRVVSGLLVYARTYEDQQRLISQFAAHTVERKYIAAVQGNLQGESGTFESKLVTDDPSLLVYSAEHGERAVTHWRVLERFKRATLVEVQLETGLRNQIRVHFAKAKHPILGERKYTGGKQGTERIFLHAAVLGFKHPRHRQEIRFEARLPPELSRWKKQLT